MLAHFQRNVHFFLIKIHSHTKGIGYLPTLHPVLCEIPYGIARQFQQAEFAVD